MLYASGLRVHMILEISHHALNSPSASRKQQQQLKNSIFCMLSYWQASVSFCGRLIFSFNIILVCQCHFYSTITQFILFGGSSTKQYKEINFICKASRWLMIYISWSGIALHAIICVHTRIEPRNFWLNTWTIIGVDSPHITYAHFINALGVHLERIFDVKWLSFMLITNWIESYSWW